MKRSSLGSWIQRLLGGALVLLLVFAMLLSSLTGGAVGVEKSVMSPEDPGRLAALLVLRELGMPAKAWRQAPLFLPDEPSVLWMPQVPPHKALESTASDSQASQDPRSPIHYGRFVRGGGTLVLPYTAEYRDWLLEDAQLELPEWEGRVSDRGMTLQLESGEELRILPQADALFLDAKVEDDRGQLGERNQELGWFDFATDGEGRALISWQAVGYGRVVFLGTDGWLDNQVLGEGDNALLLVRLAEALQTDLPILFDEFSLGLWAPNSKFDLMTSPGFLSVSLHLLLVALVFILLYAWVREFPRDPKRARLDPRLRVQAQVALFQRARRYDLLAADLQLGVLERLQKRFGLRLPELKLGRARRCARMLEELSSRLPAAQLQDGWQRLFSTRGPSGKGIQSNQDLEDLGRDLRAFEERFWAQGTPR